MKRWSTGVLAGVLFIIPALAVLGSEPTGYVKDGFESGNYSGGSSSGGVIWEGPWSEYNDDGSASSGAVHVAGENCSLGSKCLHVEKSDESPSSQGAYRSADLLEMIEGELCFYYKTASGEGTMQAWVTSDGVDWTPIWSKSFSGASNGHPIVPLQSYLLTSEFQIKLVVDGEFASEVTFDDVEIKGVVEGSGSTTTTTPSTTTTKKVTTTKSPTTTEPNETTTTTRPTPTTSRGEVTTTVAEVTTTTQAELAPFVGPTVPPNSGIRDTQRGLLASYDSRSFGSGGLGFGDIEVLGTELNADFSIAAEAFGSAKIWVAVLALLVAGAVVSGIDWRHVRRLGSN